MHMQVGCRCFTVIISVVGQKGRAYKQHPDPNKDWYQHLHRCAADVQAPIHSPSEQGALFFLECFVMVFLFCSCIIMIFEKAGRTGERVLTRGRPPAGFIRLWLCDVPMKGNRKEISRLFLFLWLIVTLLKRHHHPCV